MNTPSIRTLTCASLLGAALALGGCASNPSNAQVGTGVGAVVGGVAGSALFGSTLGTVRTSTGLISMLGWALVASAPNARPAPRAPCRKL